MTRSGSPPGAFSHPGFGAVAAALAAHAGLKIPPHRYPELEAAARRAMAESGVDDPDDYARQLADGQLSLADLVAAFTVGETYFLRHPAAFALVRTTIVPELRARRGPEHLVRAWSAGCASGEEAWSIALTLSDGPGPWHVLGTDISRPALGRARAGVYGDWSLRGPGREDALRALRRAGRRWEIDPRLRPHVRFEYLNLAEDAYPSLLGGTAGLDLILCRNVFIYFEPAVVAAVARRLHACLAEGGWLLAGLADPPLRPFAPFESISTEAGVVYRRPLPGASVAVPAVPWAESPTPPPGVARAEARPPGPGDPVPGAPPTGPRTTPAPIPAGATPGPAGRSAQEAGAGGAASPRPDALAAARAALAAGDHAGVIALAGSLLDSGDGAALLVRAAANAGDLGRAAELAQRALERHPLVPELHLLSAAVLSDLGRGRDALAAVRRAVYLDRSLAVGHAALGGLLAVAGDLAGARRAWRNVRRLCEALPPDAVLPLGDGQCAGRLSAIASAQLSMLGAGDEP